MGWLGEAKVSCILRHQGVQLILAYSWARPADLLAGMVREELFNFFCICTFIHFLLSPLSLSFISSTISSISLLPFSGRRHKLTHKGWRVVKSQHYQMNKFYANSIDPDELPRSEASDLGLNYFPMFLLWDARHKWVNIEAYLASACIKLANLNSSFMFMKR